MFEVKKDVLDSHEVILEVAFDEEAVAEAKRSAAREISREINVPGFRKGKAPYSKIIQHVGETTVLQEAAEHLLDEHYAEFLEAAEVSPYGPGEFLEVEPSPLTFKIRIPLEPEVELGDYESLRAEWADPSVSEEEIQQVLEQLREENAVLEPVDRAAEMGDQVMIDVHATVEGDVVVDEADIEVTLSEERPFLSPEFVMALMGMDAGDEKTFTLTLPETVDQPTLRGVEAEFTVKVNAVYTRELPEVDDALASAVGSFEAVDELIEDVRQRIRESKQEQTESDYRARLVDQLVDQAELAYPPQMVEDTLDDMVKEATQRIERQQKISLEDALRLEGRTLEQFRAELRPQAERRVAHSLVLNAFARAEEIEVSEDEIVQEYTDLLRQMGMAQQMSEQNLSLDSALGRNLSSNLLGRKVMRRLTRIGRGEGAEGEGDSESEADAALADEETLVADDVPGAEAVSAVDEGAPATETVAIQKDGEADRPEA